MPDLVSNSTLTPAGGFPVAGGGPPVRTATITVTQRGGPYVTVSTWDAHPALGDVVTNLLGKPCARVETNHGERT